MGENKNREKNICKPAIMRTPIKFAAVYFGVSILFLIAIYLLFPKLYPGETFMIVWFYIVNLFLGSLLFPFVWRFVKQLKQLQHKSKAAYVLASFLSIILTINILSFIFFQRSYTIGVIIAIFTKPERRIMVILEFINPILSFVISYFLFRKSSLWESNDNAASTV